MLKLKGKPRSTCMTNPSPILFSIYNTTGVSSATIVALTLMHRNDLIEYSFEVALAVLLCQVSASLVIAAALAATLQE